MDLIEKVNWTRQLANGLSYLHHRQLIHKDINPRNCLKYANGHVKITAPSLISNPLDSLDWTAPELHLWTQEFTLESDIWSFGCLIFYIFTWGKHPFGVELTRSQRVGRIMSNQFNLSELKEKTGKIRYEILIANCLTFNSRADKPSNAGICRPNISIVVDEISDLIPSETEFNLPTWMRRPWRWLIYKIKSS